MTDSAARVISIAGHPAVLMPAAAIVASTDTGNANFIVAVSLAVSGSLLVLAYSYYKTKCGHWAHIDASARGERAQLNTRVGVALVAVASALALGNVHIAVVAVFALSGLIVLAAHFVRHASKPSLHVAFAIFSALIVWPQYVATIALLLIALGVGWSRIILRRHVGLDLAWGGALGAFAGLAFQAVRISLDA